MADSDLKLTNRYMKTGTNLIVIKVNNSSIYGYLRGIFHVELQLKTPSTLREIRALKNQKIILNIIQNIKIIKSKLICLRDCRSFCQLHSIRHHQGNYYNCDMVAQKSRIVIFLHKKCRFASHSN